MNYKVALVVKYIEQTEKWSDLLKIIKVINLIPDADTRIYLYKIHHDKGQNLIEKENGEEFE